jgi:hypothetical protein
MTSGIGQLKGDPQTKREEKKQTAEGILLFELGV